jgi:S-adenosylmethionine/arginine decarboxylase-like enzyme
MAWGYHLILDCYDADKALITNSTNIAAFAKVLVKRIDMVAYGEPQVVHFGEDDKQGYTLVQLIETSNIVAHFCDESGNFYMDVFSCKPFSTEAVIETVNQFFAPKKIRERYVERD